MYERIRAFREDRDLSQGEVADILHVHQTTYSSYELGKLNIPATALIALSKLYQTSIDYLLDQTDEDRPYPRKKGDSF